MKRVGILGAGSWGATLAALLSEKKFQVTLWEFNPVQAKELATYRTLSFFPHLAIPQSIEITGDLALATQHQDFLVFVVPSHTLRGVARQIAKLKPDLSGTVIVSATKGIENSTLKRMSEVIAEELPAAAGRVVALSGPTHAEEVSQKIPSAAVAASANPEAAEAAQALFMAPYFRVYTHSDIVGVETGASLKNVFAIAAGIIDGLGLGDNTKAAMVTRGLRELSTLGTAMGGSPETFFGLTGLGDLIVTCFSRHSRNRGLGEKIGRGKSLDQSEKELVMVAEGVKTARSARELARKHGLEAPIIEQVYEVLYEQKPPARAVQELMLRDPKPEGSVCS